MKLLLIPIIVLAALFGAVLEVAGIGKEVKL
jgi:hypothetical protein